MAVPKFFADVLWNTSVLPAQIIVGGTTYNKRSFDGITPLPASINGVDSRGSSPQDKDQMIQSINQNISYYCYGGASFLPYPYDCLTNVYNGVTYPGLIPSRYITMGPGTGSGSADKLEVNGLGAANATYETTDIRTPPF